MSTTYIERVSVIAGLKGGYAVIVTDKRIIGISYARRAIRPFIPGILVFVLWIVSLVTALLVSVLSGSNEVPSAPYIMVLALVALVLLIAGFPRAEKLVRKEAPTSLSEVFQRKIDREIRKEDIADIRLNRALLGGIVTVFLKSGSTVKFYAYRKKQLAALVDLLRKFWLGEQSSPSS